MADSDSSKSNLTAIPKRPIVEEVAGSKDGRDITRGFIDSLAYLSPEDEVLRRQARGNLDVYLDLLRDDQAGPCFDQYVLSIIAHEQYVEPASEDPRDVEIADFIKAQIQHVGFDEACRQMLVSKITGYAVAECMWARDGDLIVLDDLRVRKQTRFRFSPAGDLLLLTQQKLKGERVPPAKFWVHRFGGTNSDDPYGQGIGARLYWPIFFKRNGLKFWMAALDRFGTPLTKITEPTGTTDEDHDRLVTLARTIHRDTGVVVPQGVLVEFLEGMRSASGDFGVFCERQDAAISKCILLQTMTTDEGSSRSQSEVHLSVRDQMLKCDSDLICESFNRSVVTWLCAWNFPGATPPKIWRRFEVAQDLSALADRDETLYHVGYQRTLESVTETYGEGFQVAPPSAMPAAQSGGFGGFAFAESSDVIDRSSEQLEEATDEILGSLMARVRAILAESSSLETVALRLDELKLDFQDDPALVALIQQALVAAELRGRAEVVDELDARPRGV